ncbi:9529_t:CDS:2 [Ambispora leptoticha]|uniref:9529_t:CDS:1 n=1 Tax=Ambispora leptoticha TaxID=144679 RepID=A0A9N9ALB0_9GLOM|nr:9529_t:CDS:2 [Ambispora leptoticha]
MSELLQRQKIILNHFQDDEIEFFATDELVTVEPLETIEEFELLNKRSYGPFRPGKRDQVPLWVALKWSQRRKVKKIIVPTWMSPENLELALLEERTEPEKFTSRLPLHWYQTEEKIKTIVSEILANRKEKMKAKVVSLKPGHTKGIYRTLENEEDNSGSLLINQHSLLFDIMELLFLRQKFNNACRRRMGGSMGNVKM